MFVMVGKLKNLKEMDFEIGLVKKNLRFRKIKPKSDSRDTKGNLNLTWEKTARDSFKLFVPRQILQAHLFAVFHEGNHYCYKNYCTFFDYVVLLDKKQC